MNADQQALLQASIDGSLRQEDAAAVAALLERSVEARAYVAEHTWLWSELLLACDAEGAPSESFRADVVARAHDREPAPLPLRRRLAVAAAVLIGVSLFAWSRVTAPDRPALSAEQRNVVRHLHVLRDLDFLEEYGTELDLRGDYDVMLAFAGEVEDEG